MKRCKMILYRLLILSLFFTAQSCSGQTQKINGLSFVASPDTIDHTNVGPVVAINANYCAIMPFGFIKNLEHPEIIHNTGRQWFGETRVGAKQYIEALRKKNIKIMIKPQIWVWHGQYTGHIKMDDAANWELLEESYNSFILEYAFLAQEVNAEIFCIGTELEQFVANRPEYWKNLILEIKKVYKGELTYAANWDEFKRTPFWSDLDYIGVDAYFPVSDSKTPTIAECMEGWKPHRETIKAISKTHDKPVLFTEFGYRSMDFTGKEPWESDHKIKSINFQGQSNATKALFNVFWKEDWFAGGFIWKWFHNYEDSGGLNDNQFTPQNKPVEKLIKKHFVIHE